MTGLDVHVLTLPGLPEAWVIQRRASLAEAAARAGFPVTIREVPGIPGHLGKSRLRAYSGASADYVTHVDHDDYVKPDAFSVLGDALQRGVDCITTGETLLMEDGRTHDAPQSRHHLAVFRRERVLSIGFDAFEFYPDQYLLSLHSPEHIAECVYVHRIFDHSASRTQRRAHAAAAQREYDVIGNKSLCANEGMTPAEIAALIDMEVSNA